MHRFYSVIIGTELLNGRRVDKHFAFINQALRDRGLLHVGSLVIEDSPLLIQNCFEMILNDPQSVMFCFGGIGSTPDDLTRPIASEVFTAQPLTLHVNAKALIEARYGEDAYPHRITMAMLPPGAELLHNVVNQVPGFSLFGRFFFTPGFPSMAWPMVQEALDRYFPTQPKAHSDTFVVETSENDLIEIMEALPKELSFSSLPRFVGDKRITEIYIAHTDKEMVEQWSRSFKEAVFAKGYTIRGY